MNDNWWTMIDERRLMNDDWWTMIDEWWLINDEWLMMDDWWLMIMNGDSWMMNDEWWTMIDERWLMNDDWWTMIDEQWLMNDDRRTEIDERWLMNDDRWRMTDKCWLMVGFWFVNANKSRCTVRSHRVLPVQRLRLAHAHPRSFCLRDSVARKKENNEHYRTHALLWLIADVVMMISQLHSCSTLLQ